MASLGKQHETDNQAKQSSNSLAKVKYQQMSIHFFPTLPLQVKQARLERWRRYWNREADADAVPAVNDSVFIELLGNATKHSRNLISDLSRHAQGSRMLRNSASFGQTATFGTQVMKQHPMVAGTV